MILLVIIPLIQAAPEEYLFEGEKKGVLEANIELDDGIYNIYKIENSKTGELLIMNPADNLALEQNLPKVLFSYYTYLYINNNQDKIKEQYHTTFNKLDSHTDSIAQQILSLFKKLDRLCITVPNFQFIDLCVKPTDELPVKKALGMVFIDWKDVLKEYTNLGGQVLYSMSNPDKLLKYSQIEKTYAIIVSSDEFLKIAQGTISIQLTNDILNPQLIINDIGKKIQIETENIESRMQQLRTMESRIHTNDSSNLENLRIPIKEITLFGGDVKALKLNYTSLNMDIGAISLEDNKYTSDITALKDIALKIDNFKEEVNKTLILSKEEYNKHNFVSRFFIRLWGKIKPLGI